jgi:hypothetical protein
VGFARSWVAIAHDLPLPPGTALYVGCDNGLTNLFLDNQSVSTSTVLYQSEPTNRTSLLFFVKLSYVFGF